MPPSNVDLMNHIKLTSIIVIDNKCTYDSIEDGEVMK